MSTSATRLATFLGVLAGLLVAAAPAAAAPVVNGIFPLGSEVGTNNKIVEGPDRNIWLTVEDGTNDVAKVTPAGQVEEFDIQGIESPVGIAPGPDGNLWITEIEKAAKFAPGDPLGTDEAFTIPGIGAESQVVAGPEGLIWVASNNSVVRFVPVDPVGTDQEVPVAGELSPKDIDVAGPLVVIADNSGGSRLVSFNTAGVQQDFPIASGSQGVAGRPDGQIAFSAPLAAPEQVGLIAPPNPALPIPVPGDPFGVDLGPDGAFWVVQFAEAGLTRFTASGQTQFIGGLPDESARQIAAGPGNTLWVTLTKNEANKVVPSVARVTGVDPEVINPPPTPPTQPSTPPGKQPPPTATLGKGPKKVVKTRKPKARVSFSFSSATAGASFECALTRLKGKKTKVAAFKTCGSPQTYRLRPGRYRFQVRALSGGAVGEPATARPFKVIRIR